LEKRRAGGDVYNWGAYASRFGFCDVERVGNIDAAGRYITKYMTKNKETAKLHIKSGNHLYYASRGLKLPERVLEGDYSDIADKKPEGLHDGFKLVKEFEIKIPYDDIDDDFAAVASPDGGGYDDELDAIQARIRAARRDFVYDDGSVAPPCDGKVIGFVSWFECRGGASRASP
jgi:hypothetical protein